MFSNEPPAAQSFDLVFHDRHTGKRGDRLVLPANRRKFRPKLFAVFPLKPARLPSLNARHCFDLDAKAIMQRRNGNYCPSGQGDANPLRIYSVEGGPVADVCDVDTNLN